MTTLPTTDRGRATRERILVAAEAVFAELGYDAASIVRITERAGIGQGTFYLYFDGKARVFDEVVDDLNRRVRHAMSDASAGATTRLEAERRGFEGFFRFTAEHPSLYRIIRQAEFVSPGALRRHYDRIVEGYIVGLTAARAADEIGSVDPEVAAWVLMGIGEMVGMRWVLWGDTAEVPPAVLDDVMAMISRALDARTEGTQ